MTPPHNIESEQALLGALLLNNEVLDRCPGLVPEHFFDPVHARIFEAIRAKVHDGRLASAVTLKGPMAADAGLQELGGTDYLARLAGSAVGIAVAPQHATLIRELHARRQLADVIAEAQERVDAGALASEDIVSGLETRLTDLAMAGPKPLIHSWTRVLNDAVTQTDEAYKAGGEYRIKTGLGALDSIIGGFLPGRVYTLAGRPSMGKTAIAGVIADNIAQSGAGVLWASLEMEDAEIGTRMLSRRMALSGARVPYSQIEAGRLSEDQFRLMMECAADYERAPIVTVDESCSNLPQFQSSVRAAEKALVKRGAPLALIVIDYLQLMHAPGFRPGTEMIEALSSAVKQLARRHKVPVLLLSQLNRGVEDREDKRPLLRDLRQSGRIEEDSHCVLFAFRHSYYLDREPTDGMSYEELSDHRATLEAAAHDLEIIVAKNRSGPLGVAHLWCDLAVNAVADRQEGDMPI